MFRYLYRCKRAGRIKFGYDIFCIDNQAGRTSSRQTRYKYSSGRDAMRVLAHRHKHSVNNKSAVYQRIYSLMVIWLHIYNNMRIPLFDN